MAANPLSIVARMKLGGLLLASRNYREAIRTYQQTISLNGNNAKAWMGLGLAYLHAGEKDLSQAAFSEAIRVDPDRRSQLAGLAESSAK